MRPIKRQPRYLLDLGPVLTRMYERGEKFPAADGRLLETVASSSATDVAVTENGGTFLLWRRSLFPSVRKFLSRLSRHEPEQEQGNET